MLTPLLISLRQAVGFRYVDRSEPSRIAYSSDMWPRHQIWKQANKPAVHQPTAVVRPANEAEISAVVGVCHRHGVPLIPYGGGSGVCGGTMPIHGGVVMDVKRLNRFISVDDVDLTVTAQAGIIGMHLEEELADRGYTLGHFPSSILCSTLGGWLAARSAGQLSSRYGKIEDMVVSMRTVLADGSVLESGPESDFDWTQIIVGSEGILGTVTEATLRIHPAPAARAYRGYRFRSVEAGMRGMRRLMQAGLRPHVMRLYDPFDSLLHSSDGGDSSSHGGGLSALLNPVRELLGSRVKQLASGQRARGTGLAIALASPTLLNKLIDTLPVSSLMVLGFEGGVDEVDGEMAQARGILESLGGVDGGSAPGLRWEKNRYNVSFKQSPMFSAGAFVDTMEVATTWAKLPTLYATVREAVAPFALVMAHFSHSYREGCSIYFTFAAHKRDNVALERHYERLWSEALSAVLRGGGSISHHHGIGYAKKEHMRREHGAGIRLLYAVKDALDPRGTLNPGKVLPDRAIHE